MNDTTNNKEYKKYIVFSGNWKASVLFDTTDQDHQEMIYEIATQAFEIVMGMKDIKGMVDVFELLDEKGKNVMDDKYSLDTIPEPQMDIYTTVHLDGDDRENYHLIFSSIIAANAAMYKLSVELQKMEKSIGKSKK